MTRLALITALLAVGCQPPGPCVGPPLPHAAMGIMVGEVTDRAALAQVRLTRDTGPVDRDLPGSAGVVQFTLTPADGSAAPTVQLIEATAERDFIARAEFSGLSPDTRYLCSTRIGKPGAMVAGPEAQFRTLPGAEIAAAVRLVVVTGMNYAKFHGDERIDKAQHLLENNRDLPPPYQGPDKPLGYPALETMLKIRPDFFVGTGDNVYYDTPDNPRAQTIAELRQKWHEQFVQPRFVQLFAKVPTYWEIDDHDYRIDDGDNSGDYDPTPAVGRQLMLEQLPVAPAGAADALTYRTHRISRDLQIWLTENRMHRSDNALADGPHKSIWGAAQKEWLRRTLQESDATFKLLISPTPMVGPDDLRKTDNHTNVGGFRHERDDFFAWVKQAPIENLYLVCGDRHWQYHALDPSGMEEFSSGALVDANSRLGRKPGDPKSTDPDGTIRHLYYQEPASGGFLQIQCKPATADGGPRLTFEHYDERGRLLYQHTKDATPS